MKKTGVLLPIFSLPSKRGIGSFGKSAYEFVDFLAEASQSYWQILPLNPTGFGDSPYQSPSAFAGNPYFIDLDMLVECGYLTEDELPEKPCGRIDYGALYCERYPLLRKAFSRFLQNVPEDFFSFVRREAYWLDSYTLYMALKGANLGKELCLWQASERNRENEAALIEKHGDEIDFHCFLQYIFDVQWKALRSYANSKGIRIIGDIPIYVSLDSADVFGAPENFLLDRDLRPTFVAGVPPDAFSKEGQLWGNPLYDWDKMRENGYKFWCNRMKRASELYDDVRIDHFVGFSNYYAIPKNSDSALSGEIRRGVGYALFMRIREVVPGVSIIAEDLGMLQDGVAELLSQTGFPGMKVMQFSLGGKDNPHAPENHTENCVVYTGTHDNPTSLGFYRDLTEHGRRKLRARLPKTSRNTLDRFIDYALSTPAKTVIIPIQDYMGLGNEARINTPSTKENNWSFMLPENYRTQKLLARIIAHTGSFNK